MVLLRILGCIGSLKPGDAQLLETAGTLCGLGLLGSSVYGQRAARMHQAQRRRGPRQCNPQQTARMAIIPWTGDRAQASACCCRRHPKSQEQQQSDAGPEDFLGSAPPACSGLSVGETPATIGSSSAPAMLQIPLERITEGFRLGGTLTPRPPIPLATSLQEPGGSSSSAPMLGASK